MAPRMAMWIGHRTVLAMTCRQCGKLKSGDDETFPRYRRSIKDRILYKSRRCKVCWWQRMAESPGR